MNTIGGTIITICDATRVLPQLTHLLVHFATALSEVHVIYSQYNHAGFARFSLLASLIWRVRTVAGR
jgi:hypothetical protein